MLTDNAIRFFEGCVEFLDVAVSSLGSTKRGNYQTEAKYSPEIGLIGVACELAMSGCLVQAYTEDFLEIPNMNRYKSANEILSDFKTLVKQRENAAQFIYAGIEDIEAHQNRLIDISLSFRNLINYRAMSLHSASGPARETVTFMANRLSDFLELLSQSNTLESVLSYIPRCLTQYKDRSIFISDLQQKLNTGNTRGKLAVLASLYLVLPEVSDKAPDWLDTFHRATVSPREQDIVYLMNVLQRAIPVSLRKVSGGSDITIPTRYDPDNPNAVPFEVQQMKNKFSELRDIVKSQIGIMNGDLDKGFFEPRIDPESIYALFADGLFSTGLLQNGEKFRASDTWAFIASALGVQRTPPPYWFILQQSNDLRGVAGQLKRVQQESRNPYFHRRIGNCLNAIDALTKDRPVGDDVYREIVEEQKAISDKLASIPERIEYYQGRDYELTDYLETIIMETVEQERSVDEALRVIDTSSLNEKAKSYWIGKLSETAKTVEDAKVIASMLAKGAYKSKSTQMYRALRRIDILCHGPEVQID